MKILNEELVKLAKETAFSYDEISRVYDEFESQDLETSKVLERTQSVLILATVSTLPLGEVTEAVKVFLENYNEKS